MLAEYEQCGNRDDALWALAQLHSDDPVRYRQIVGHDRVLKADTLRSEYWRRIPVELRDAARDRYLERAQPSSPG